ncbi:glycosyltransferase family 4 protein [Epibacterium ulvae]|uniref:glycosyltransferase family 4 protein n=1 Tax=Epibacterium ulvae TaxID=1156985 RepID=UPI001BFCAE63|nr:glycosyltransferase family 4 protein [Epibacterium ulvae]
MKIVYVLNTYPQPSHSFIRREIQALERQGFEVARLAMRASDAPLVDDGDTAEAAKTEYVLAKGLGALARALLREVTQPGFGTVLKQAIAMGRQSSTGVLRHLIYLGEAAWVKQRCASQGGEHMHAHFGTNSTAVAMLAHLLGGPTYSFTAHGPEEFDVPQSLSLGAKVNASAFTVAISSFGRSQLSRWAEFDAWDRIKIVHCGIEPQKFADPAEMPDGDLRLAAIGRFVEQKGQMVLVHAFADVVKAQPKAQLYLIGDGDLRADLEAAIAHHGIGDNVTLTGWLDEAGVRAQLAQAHALVMPSFAEGLPMVVMEAMAAARPVIATYIAGTPELVVPGQTGWMVPAGDQEQLARAILELAETSTDRRAEMGQVGRLRVLERHDSDTEAAKLAAHIRSTRR